MNTINSRTDVPRVSIGFTVTMLSIRVIIIHLLVGLGTRQRIRAKANWVDSRTTTHENIEENMFALWFH